MRVTVTTSDACAPTNAGSGAAGRGADGANLAGVAERTETPHHARGTGIPALTSAAHSYISGLLRRSADGLCRCARAARSTVAGRKITLVLVSLVAVTVAASTVVMAAGADRLRSAPRAETTPFLRSPGTAPVVVPDGPGDPGPKGAPAAPAGPPRGDGAPVSTGGTGQHDAGPGPGAAVDRHRTDGPGLGAAGNGHRTGDGHRFAAGSGRSSGAADARRGDDPGRPAESAQRRGGPRRPGHPDDRDRDAGRSASADPDRLVILPRPDGSIVVRFGDRQLILAPAPDAALPVALPGAAVAEPAEYAMAARRTADRCVGPAASDVRWIVEDRAAGRAASDESGATPRTAPARRSPNAVGGSAEREAADRAAAGGAGAPRGTAVAGAAARTGSGPDAGPPMALPGPRHDADRGVRRGSDPDAGAPVDRSGADPTAHGAAARRSPAATPAAQHTTATRQRLRDEADRPAEPSSEPVTGAGPDRNGGRSAATSDESAGRAVNAGRQPAAAGGRQPDAATQHPGGAATRHPGGAVSRSPGGAVAHGPGHAVRHSADAATRRPAGATHRSGDVGQRGDRLAAERRAEFGMR